MYASSAIKNNPKSVRIIISTTPRAIKINGSFIKWFLPVSHCNAYSPVRQRENL
jgi:hypothetical protein